MTGTKAGRSGTIRDDAQQVRGAWKGWVFPLGMIGLWCAPAVGINAAYGLQTGREPALIGVSMAAVIFTAMCALRLETKASLPMRLLTVALVLIGVAYNLSNAIGLAAGHRSHDRSAALTSQGRAASIRDDIGTIKAEIARLNTELGASSSTSIKAEIAAREFSPVFDRTKHCADATLADSRDHCAAWERAKAMLKAAERRDDLQTQMADMNERLRAAPVVEAVDPQAETIAHALALAGITMSPAAVGDVLSWLLAIVAELMAAFGALMCGVRLPGHSEAAATEKAEPKAKAQAKPQAVPAPAIDPLAVFVGELVASKVPTPFKALRAAYERQCQADGKTPVSPRQIGLELSKRFEKAKGGARRYHCRTKAAELRVVGG